MRKNGLQPAIWSGKKEKKGEMKRTKRDFLGRVSRFEKREERQRHLHPGEYEGKRGMSASTPPERCARHYAFWGEKGGGEWPKKKKDCPPRQASVRCIFEGTMIFALMVKEGEKGKEIIGGLETLAKRKRREHTHLLW